MDRLDFINLTYKGDYAVFATRYLMREDKGAHGRIFYKRYIALGVDPTYIRDQLYVSSVVPGELPPHRNSRETVADSDDEDPMVSERFLWQVVEMVEARS